MNIFKNIFKEKDISNYKKRSYNELEILAEELECVNMWLDSEKIPTHDTDNRKYSTIGRIKLMIEKIKTKN